MKSLKIPVLLLIVALASALVAQDRTPATFGEDVAELMEARDVTLAELEARYHAATDEVAMLEALHAVNQHKHDTEVELLKLQVIHARRAGDEAAATTIEAAIEKLQTPPTPVSTEEAREASRRRRSEGESHD